MFDLQGQEVAVLDDGRRPAGRHTVTVDAVALGLASGLYVYQLHTPTVLQSRTMLLVK